MEDGLQLWLATVQNSVGMAADDELLLAFSNIELILARDFDNLRDCMQLISGYMMLGADVFMAAHAQNVINILAKCLGNVNEVRKAASASSTRPRSHFSLF